MGRRYLYYIINNVIAGRGRDPKTAGKIRNAYNTMAVLIETTVIILLLLLVQYHIIQLSSSQSRIITLQ